MKFQVEAPLDEAFPRIPQVEFDRHTKLAFEKEMLGYWITDHPYKEFKEEVSRLADHTIGFLKTSNPLDGLVYVGGIATNVKLRTTRRGDTMAKFELEDLENSIDVVVFPKFYREFGDRLRDDIVVVVGGRMDDSEDGVLGFICLDLKVVADGY